jgi:hypothetical protein
LAQTLHHPVATGIPYTSACGETKCIRGPVYCSKLPEGPKMDSSLHNRPRLGITGRKPGPRIQVPATKQNVYGVFRSSCGLQDGPEKLYYAFPELPWPHLGRPVSYKYSSMGTQSQPDSSPDGPQGGPDSSQKFPNIKKLMSRGQLRAASE